MKNHDFDELESLCARRAREFSGLEDAAYRYAACERMDRPLHQALRKWEGLLESFPKNFPGILIGTFIMHRIFGSEPNRRRFFARSAYRPENAEALSGLVSMPWQFRFLYIEKRLVEGFFTVHFPGSPEEALLYSPSVERIEIHGRPLLLCGVFGDETCLQTFGPVLDLPAFDWTDIETFAKLAAPDSFSTLGVSGVLNREPLSFFLLYAFSRFNLSFRGKQRLRYASGTFRADADFLETAESLGPPETVKGGKIIKLQAVDRFDSFVKLLVEGKRGRAALVASSPVKYRNAARKEPLLGRAPDEPEFIASMTMILAIEKILRKPFPGLQENHRPDPDEAGADGEPGSRGAARTNGRAAKNDRDGKDDAFLEGLNAAMKEYTNHTNRNTTPLDPGAIAKKHGVDPITFAELVGSVERNFEEHFHIDVPGGIAGFVPPPPEFRHQLELSLDEAPAFRVNSGEAIERELAASKDRIETAVPEGTRGAITFDRLVPLLERATKEILGNGARVALNYTLYLLLREGEGYRPVVDYGSELLRTFWQVLIPTRDADQVASFLKCHALWTYHVLGSFGLVTMEHDLDLAMLTAATFSIRCGPFLEHWIELKE